MVGSNSKVVNVDLSQITQETELVEFIIKQLNFPDLYGNNWHALEQNFYYDPMLNVPNKMRLIGFSELSNKAPTLAAKLLLLLNSHKGLDLEIINA